MPGSGQTTPAAKVPARNVVLVHGPFTDGSCWSDVIGRLQASGLNVTMVQNSLTTLDDAADAVRRVLALTNEPTVPVGHSFAGTIISEVGEGPNVSVLVYVAARMPDAGGNYAALGKKSSSAPTTAGVIFDDDEGRLSEQVFLHSFAGDVPSTRAHVLYATQQPSWKALTQARAISASWRLKPAYYPVSENDRTINPDLQRFMAKRVNAHFVSLGASHLSLISHADNVAGLIELAARGA